MAHHRQPSTEPSARPPESLLGPEPGRAEDRSVRGTSTASDPLDPLSGLRPLAEPTWRDRADDLIARLLDAPVRAVALLVGVVLVAGAAWWFVRPPAAAPIESRIPRAVTGAGATTTPADPNGALGSSPSGATSTTEAAEVVVAAAGAVRDPGVHRLPAGARVDDLVAAAGGLTPDADPDRINLAAPLTDGARVWVPRRGDWGEPEVVAGAPSPPSGGAGGGSTPTGSDSGAGDAPTTVDLNRAGAEELEALPGVGPATAAAIVAHREAHGPFGSVDDLLDVRGIGEAKLEQIRPVAVVG